jgi:magnesium chelatase family protein
MFLGELSLDGGLRHINGILPMVVVAREEGIKSVFLPEQDAREATLVEGVDIIPLKSLTEMVDHLDFHQYHARPNPVTIQSKKKRK